MLLQISDVYKSFENQPVLRGVSMSVEEGEIVVLLGPSGCGKTTLLRIIAGLETVDRGKLLLSGENMDQIPVHKRRFGMVFQDFALFPHKNVRQNVGFGLRMLGWDRPRMEERVEHVLSLVGLEAFGERAVHDLSGGEQQRVALARALAPFPRLLLLDEPLGSLDRALRERLMGELRSILTKASDEARQTLSEYAKNSSKPAAMTSVYVTHDQEEAFAIADRIFVMKNGQIEQVGKPIELYRRPQTAFVARFLGMENLFDAEVVSLDPPIVKSALGELEVASLAGRERGPASLLIRPEAASLATEEDRGPNLIEGQLTDISFRGRHQVVTLQVDAVPGPVELKLNFESTVNLPTDSTAVQIKLDPAGLRLLTR